jgi:hypothetical protein
MRTQLPTGHGSAGAFPPRFFATVGFASLTLTDRYLQLLPINMASQNFHCPALHTLARTLSNKTRVPAIAFKDSNPVPNKEGSRP